MTQNTSLPELAVGAPSPDLGVAAAWVGLWRLRPAGAAGEWAGAEAALGVLDRLVVLAPDRTAVAGTGAEG